MNPGRLFLLIGGVAAVLIGVRGSQSQAFAALTGKGLSTSSSPSSSTPPTTSTTPGGIVHLVGQPVQSA